MIKIVLFVLLLPGLLWAEPLDRIIAVVNNEAVLASDLKEMSRTVRQRLAQRNAAIPSDDILQTQLLERLIIQRIQLQKASEMGIRVGDNHLNAVLSQIAKNNNLTLREFRDILQNDGFGFADFRESVRNDIIVNRLQKSQVEDKIFISEREIDNFLATQIAQGGAEENYHLLHILISLPPAASPDEVQAAKRKLMKVQSLLQDGIDFSEAATSYSDGPNALEGGDLGWRKRGELPSLFTKVVPQLDILQVSDALRSSSGFHLVKLVDKKAEKTKYMVKQTLVSHILIQTDELNTDKQIENRLNSLRERILYGEDFAELARAHSDDIASAIEGGSLDWVIPGSMVPEFEEKMNALELGAISEVFKSRFGWHLVKVYDRREKNMAKELKRIDARKQIHQRKIAEELASWLHRIRDEAYVDYRD